MKKTNKIISKMFLMSLGFSIYLFSSGEHIDWSVSMPGGTRSDSKIFTEIPEKSICREKSTKNNSAYARNGNT